jgi:hypothetical protein
LEALSDYRLLQDALRDWRLVIASRYGLRRYSDLQERHDHILYRYRYYDLEH